MYLSFLSRVPECKSFTRCLRWNVSRRRCELCGAVLIVDVSVNNLYDVRVRALRPFG